MQEIKSFNEFQKLQTEIFRSIFKNVDIKSQKFDHSLTTTILKEAMTNNQSFESSIQELNVSKSPRMEAVNSLKKDVKRLSNIKIGEVRSSDKASQSSKKKSEDKTIKLSSGNVCKPQLELID